MAVGNPGDRLGYLIWQLSQAYIQRLEQALRPLGLTQTQYSALMRLTLDGALSGAELARRCGVTAQSMGSALQGLADRGLVERHAHPTHGRIIEIRVTPSGALLAEQGEQALLPCEEEALAPFEDREKARLKADLRRMLRTLSPHALPPE
ncbi:MarR family winged helix-turn-helix transcriptional regulator [Streptomyces sp. NPDC088354]|uniref:MarR family winged helix-turn-helix transcriptional regulator n=1 Tax=unclassified Streptomyces TaxID=2593676 RepID=UPI0029B2582C|nr:MarR family transcriptional regulator [Streptomyces sp. MI02-7b]MDX3073128.1 MarR family transcriptional regulator [Streptomyces sp. MI02-7b]